MGRRRERAELWSRVDEMSVQLKRIYVTAVETNSLLLFDGDDRQAVVDLLGECLRGLGGVASELSSLHDSVKPDADPRPRADTCLLGSFVTSMLATQVTALRMLIEAIAIAGAVDERDAAFVDEAAQAGVDAFEEHQKMLDSARSASTEALYVMSHLYAADEAPSVFRERLERFEAVRERVTGSTWWTPTDGTS